MIYQSHKLTLIEFTLLDPTIPWFEFDVVGYTKDWKEYSSLDLVELKLTLSHYLLYLYTLKQYFAC